MKNYGLDWLCPAGSWKEQSCWGWEFYLVFSSLGLAETIQPELGERHRLIYFMFLPFQERPGFHVLAPGSTAGCPCAGHYPAAGTSCWN